MRKRQMIGAAAFVLALATAVPAMANDEPDPSCWGQVSAVFAQTGAMGEHASEQPTPRAGLANLADALADAGIIPDDSLAALGRFVAGELGLTVEACA